jgi:hypothetical protein
MLANGYPTKYRGISFLYQIILIISHSIAKTACFTMNDFYAMDILSDVSHADAKWKKDNLKYLPCGHFDEGRLYDPIVINDREFVTKYIMGTIVQPWTFYFREDFLDCIYSDLLEEGAILGNIISSKNGKFLDKWKTVFLPQIIIRGGVDSTFWICPKCMRKFYYHQNNAYILECDIKNKRIALSQTMLIFNSNIYRKITSLPTWSKMRKKTIFRKLPVATCPSDGFPVNLDDTPESLYRSEYYQRYKYDSLFDSLSPKRQ